jgi:single-strand DNA-binding protein
LTSFPNLAILFLARQYHTKARCTIANVNQVILIGRLTRDPELKYTQGGTAVTETSLAINKQWTQEDGTKREEVTFVDVTIWARRAEVFCQYMTKGREVYIRGELKLDRWEAQDGSKRQKLKVVANDVQFIGSKGGGERRDGSPAPRDEDAPPQRDQQGGQRQPAPSSGDSDFGLDEDVPF